MTHIVIDTSVIVAVIANEPVKSALIALTRGVNLLAPGSVPWEIGNAFSAMLKRKRITLEQAQQAVATYHKIPIRFVEVELTEALQLANELGIYAYDAYVVWCAIRMRAPLLALDTGLIEAAKRVQVKVLEVKE
jgi:predicted nucleic acid-binding protein